MTLYDRIRKRIPHGRRMKSQIPEANGGLVLSRGEADALEGVLWGLDGVHIDVGTYFGGSAILAALAKQRGKVYSIDSQNTGHWVDGIVTEQMVRENIAYFGVSHMIELVRSNSHPWPLRLWAMVTSAFIDGDEFDGSGCGGPLHDWENLKGVVTRFIAFHDCTDQYPGVVRTVERAMCDPEWELIKSVDSLRIFRRR